MATTALSFVAAKALPGLASESFTYNAEKNIYLSMGFTSALGNTYFKALRLSDKLAVFFSIGEGCYYTFLNGINIFALSGNGQARLIGQKQWGGSNWCVFSEAFAKNQCVELLSDFLMGEAKKLGSNATRQEADSFATALIQETYQKLLK